LIIYPSGFLPPHARVVREIAKSSLQKIEKDLAPFQGALEWLQGHQEQLDGELAKLAEVGSLKSAADSKGHRDEAEGQNKQKHKRGH
jgi:hypothetical protein